MKIYKELIQQSPEWFKVRSCKVTGSHAQAIGNNGSGLKTYIMQLMTEHFSIKDKDHYSNADMDRGNELEPIARTMYELKTDNNVEQIGFCERDEYIGCSPDGLVNDNGIIEIKCPNNEVYFNLLLNEKIETKYIWQCQMNMLVLERKWCDLIFYNPNFKNSMKIFKLNPDPEKFKKLEIGFESAKMQILDIINKYNNLK